MPRHTRLSPNLERIADNRLFDLMENAGVSNKGAAKAVGASIWDISRYRNNKKVCPPEVYRRILLYIREELYRKLYSHKEAITDIEGSIAQINVTLVRNEEEERC